MTFPELLEDIGIPFIAEGHEHCREGWIQLDCHRCTRNSQHWRLGFNIRYGYANCWLCGRIGTAEILQEQAAISWQRAKELLKDVVAERPRYSTDEIIGKYEEPPATGDLKPIHKSYLRNVRGHSVKKLQKLWEIQGVGAGQTKYDWRIFIPIIYRGERVSFTTRAITEESKIRYLSAEKRMEKINHKKLLYGDDYVRSGGIIVHEGPIDVWRTGPGATCTFGTDFTSAQVNKIAKHAIRVLCFDSTPEAQAKALQLYRLLSLLPGKTYNVVLDAKDADTASPKETKLLRKMIGE